jgi:hypothetical protein
MHNTREVSGPILRGVEEQVHKGTCSPCSGRSQNIQYSNTIRYATKKQEKVTAPIRSSFPYVRPSVIIWLQNNISLKAGQLIRNE